MPGSQAEQFGSQIKTMQPRKIEAIALFHPILEAMELPQVVNAVVPSAADIDLGRIVTLLVLNRLLAPQPLYHVHTWLSGTVLPEVLKIPVDKVYDNRLGRALDRLHPYWGEVWARVVTRAIEVYALDLNVLHWDITSLYFEGAYTDSALITYGYSRDHRPDCKQLNLEADVTHDGYVPLLYQPLPGNTADICRPIPHLQHLLQFLRRPELADRQLRPILVSDCKMVTAEAVAACHHHQLYYLGPLPNGTAATRVLRSVGSEELARHPLAYRPKRIKPHDPHFEPYQGVWRPFTVETPERRFTDRALVVWSAGKHRLDAQKRKTHLKRLLDKLAGIQAKLNTRRYKKRHYVEQRLISVQQGNQAKGLVDIQLAGQDEALQLFFHINHDRLARAQMLDGRYALATNAEHLDASTALTLFKGQDGVEKRFRHTKGPLQVRPLFVRSDARLEGLVAITLLALLVGAILERACRQRGLASTTTRLVREFASLQAVDVIWNDGSQQRQLATVSSEQQQILTALDWPSPEQYAVSAT
ncbi:IS1634 family transposase [Candidatus Uhrbacteria bacterium]|nr:IS1634 family transposase [Candidatus Uhrbacteria bacterium]